MAILEKLQDCNTGLIDSIECGVNDVSNLLETKNASEAMNKVQELQTTLTSLRANANVVYCLNILKNLRVAGKHTFVAKTYVNGFELDDSGDGQHVGYAKDVTLQIVINYAYRDRNSNDYFTLRCTMAAGEDDDKVIYTQTYIGNIEDFVDIVQKFCRFIYKKKVHPSIYPESLYNSFHREYAAKETNEVVYTNSSDPINNLYAISNIASRVWRDLDMKFDVHTGFNIPTLEEDKEESIRYVYTPIE